MTTPETSSREFVISRTFNAPRDRVWTACTNVDHMEQWFSPKGFRTRVATMDLRPGGMYHYCLASPEGQEIWGKFVYREIDPPNRIVFVNSFSDADGGITRHPMSPGWPLQMLSTFTFQDDDEKTTFTVNWSPIDPSAEERKTFDEGHESMTQGWTGTLDQLEEYLAKQ